MSGNLLTPKQNSPQAIHMQSRTFDSEHPNEMSNLIQTDSNSSAKINNVVLSHEAHPSSLKSTSIEEKRWVVLHYK